MPRKQPTIDAHEVDVDPFQPTPANRARAHKLRLQRRANKILDEADETWLAGYEEARAEVSEGLHRGASRARRVSYTEEEQEAAGEGDPATAAAAAGSMVREEGRRLDSMIGVSMAAMQRAFDMGMRICDQMAKRNELLERAHVDMMNAYRANFLSRVESEGEVAALRNQVAEAAGGEKDALSTLAEQLLPLLLQQLPGAGPGEAEVEAGAKK